MKDTSERHPIARGLVYVVFLSFCVFVAFAIIRSLIVELYITPDDKPALNARALSPREQQDCKNAIKELHNELRSELFREMRNPYLGNTPDERWHEQLVNWEMRYKNWASSCAIPGQRTLQEMFAELASEKEGYKKLAEFYFEHIRASTLTLQDFYKEQ